MKYIPYISVVGSLLNVYVTRTDIAVLVLGRFMFNPEIVYWKSTKKVIRHL